MLFDDSSEEWAHARRPAEVAGRDESLVALADDLPDELVSLRTRCVDVHDHLITVFRKMPRDDLAQPAACSRHQRDCHRVISTAPVSGTLPPRRPRPR